MNAPSTKRLSIIWGSLVLIASVFGVGGTLGWHKYKTIQAASQQPPPPMMPERVSIVPATPISYRASVTAIGTIRAPRSITLRNEIAGQVIDVPLQDGQIVEKGQVLLVLDQSVDEALLLSAQARQRMAKSMLDRTRRIANANASSGNEIDQSEAEMAQADAEIARLRAIIDKKTLRAPFRAKAGLLNTYLGQYLSEGTEITSLQGIDDHIHIDFMMPQVVADSVEIGQKVSLLVEPQPLEAEIIALDSMADRSTRNLMGRAKLTNPPPFLQPNDSVKVDVSYGNELTGIAVPAESLQSSPSGAFIYVAQINKSGAETAVPRLVAPGPTIGKSVVIKQGLTIQDRVIVDGSFKLHDGALIVDRDPPSAPATETEAPIAKTVRADS